MAAQQAKRKHRLVRLLSVGVLASGALLFWLLLLGAATANSPIAVARMLDTPTSTDTPTVGGGITPTVVPTATTSRGRPTATATSPTLVPTATTAGNGGGAVGGVVNGPTGPQQTEVALSQPTVEGGSSPLGGLSPSSFGTNGLLIATTLGCVVAVLGIAVGAIAFYALVQNGYGPFLRALALGTGDRKRRKTKTAEDAGWNNSRSAPRDVGVRRSGSGWNSADDRRSRPGVSRRGRDGW